MRATAGATLFFLCLSWPVMLLWLWRLSRRVTMLEASAALRGNVQGYGGANTPSQMARAPRREP